MTPLTFVCWRWQSRKHAYRSTFGPDTVRTLQRMIARHYHQPHRFLCVTDRPEDLPDVETVKLWDEFRDLPAPQGPKNPSCYVRLKAYAAEIADLFGPRFVSIDLDVVITGDITPLFHRPEDFVIWGDTNQHTYYNGGLVLMNAGARRQVWDTFDPVQSPKKAAAKGCFGSDQAWISYCLGPGEKKWTKADGVYSYRNDMQLKGRQRQLPDNAKLVSCHGRFDPWGQEMQSLAWVKEHYQ